METKASLVETARRYSVIINRREYSVEQTVSEVTGGECTVVYDSNGNFIDNEEIISAAETAIRKSEK
jgi:hypothetical protein